MSDSTSGSRPERTSGPPTSSRWLLVAIVVTILAGALAFALLRGMASWPSQDSALQSPTPSDVAETMTVAVARTPGGPGEWENWARIIKELSDELGRPVSVRYLSDEDQAADQIAEEDIDIAFVCAHHYLDLRDSGEAVGIVTPVLDGKTTSRMLLIVRADDEAESFEDLQGSSVAASDKSSLGGYAYLTNLAIERGVDLIDHFSEVRLGDTQESNLAALGNGEVRATVVNSAQVLDWDMSPYKFIEQSPEYGLPPVVVEAGLSQGLIDEIREALLGMDVTAVAGSDTRIEGFEVLDDSEYAYAASLRDACGSHEHP